MKPEELLAYLTQQGIELWFEGDKLHYRGKRSTLPPSLVAELRQHKSELLMLLRARSAEIRAPFPLSYAQKSLWFLYQMNPTSSAYNVSFAVTLRGALSLPALRAAVEQLCGRHRILRTRLRLVDGVPWQEVDPQGRAALVMTDATGWTPERLSMEVHDEAHRPFDLLRDPPLRVCLYRGSATESVLLLCLHHIYVDGWSIAILVRELGALYRADIAGRPASLPIPSAEYADFVHWQERLIGSAEGEKLLRYWTGELGSELGGELPPLELPTDRPRPAVRSERGGRVLWTFDTERTQSLRAFAVQQGATLYTVLLSAFAALLHRYGGQEEILLGSPFHGRSEPRFNAVVGCFINSFVLRSRIRPDTTFEELLAQVAKRSRMGLAHADYPFPLLVESLHPERSPGRTPLFQAMFSYENFHGSHLLPTVGTESAEGAADTQLFGLLLEPFPLSQQEGQFDLSLSASEVGARLHFGLAYDAELFDAETITRMASHFSALIQSAVGDPTLPIQSLGLLSDAERKQVLQGWNPVPKRVNPEDTFPRLFREQVERSPDAMAVSYEEQSLSYRQLYQRAAQLSHLLRARGVGPEVKVGLCVERSVELVVAIVGIWLAGGAYVPLEPQLPSERLRYMLEDSEAVMVVTNRQHAGLFETRALECVFVEDLSPPSSVQDAPQTELRGHNLAYCIYTSGSTGQPKGVLVEHGAMIQLPETLWDAAKPAARDGLRVSLNASVMFDASVNMLMQLLQGHSVHVLPQRVRLSVSALVKYVKEKQLDVLDCTPTVLKEWVDAGLLEGPAHVPAWIWIGGEAVPQALWAALKKAPQTRFLNLYGPTECTVWNTLCEIGPGPELPSIGKPFGSVRAYILDEKRNPTPIGFEGEIYLSGPGVARGYQKKPEQTAEKFQADPFVWGERMYRTGDRGRWRGDGNIEYLGRKDQQVKVRGYRIELGEIEAALREQEGVKDCAVEVREIGGDKKLVAYVIGEGGAELVKGEVRARLKEKLPEYMIPGVYVRMESFPLTTSGKLDRRALPDPAPESLSEPTMGALRTPIEELLAELWKRLLGVSAVSPGMNFFEQGGHSLLAMQLQARLRGLCGVDLPVRTVFEAPTLGALAQRVSEAMAEGLPKLPPIQAGGERREAKLSYAQQRLWLLQMLEPQATTYNTTLGWRVRGALDAAALQRSLDALALRHQVLRTRVLVTEGEPRALIEPSGSWPLEVMDASHEAEPEQQAERLLRDAARRPFALGLEVPVRGLLVRVGADEHWLLLAVHHMAIDGWSTVVLMRELSALYRAEQSGGPANLPELPVQYADYATAQRSWLESKAKEAQLQYWKQKLTPLPEPLELPTDHVRRTHSSGAGGLYEFALDGKTTLALKELCWKEGATPFMGLVAAYQVLLHRYSGQEDFCIGTPVAGRSDEETERLIGCFVNTLVLRAELGNAPSFRELLGRVRETALHAYTHAELPFEALVEALNPPRDASRAPIVQAMFVLQDTVLVSPTLAGLQCVPLEVHTATAKFDLLMAMADVPDGMQGRIEYAADLFDRESIARMARHFVALLRSAVANPEQSISGLTMLMDDERKQVLEAWNATRYEHPDKRLMPERLSAQAAATPDALAVVSDAESLSYAQLERRANQLAHRLVELGCAPGHLLGIHLLRGVDLLVALYGVLKAGGGYVPLDPELPAARLDWQIQSSGLGIVLTQSRIRPELPPLSPDIRVVEVDTEPLAGQPATAPQVALAASHAMYAIFTSGSTGRPKAAVNEHGAVLNRLLWMQRRYGWTPETVMLQKTPYSFDVSVWELFQPTLAGATLVMAEPGGHREPQYLAKLIEARGVKAVHFVPSMLREFVTAVESGRCGTLKQIFCSGEALPVDLAQECLRKFPGVELHNLYGPTEAAVEVTAWECHAGDERMSIGRPVDNTRIYILDALGEPTPVGVPGEIYIAGVQVGRGYLNQPEQTAEKFQADPFVGGERMYRTGDRGRWRGDGNIEYLGRKDQQVKVRGYRIELGEIEAALREQEGVKDCAVEVREIGGDKKLVAYVIGEGGAELVKGEVRARLKEKLPEYMIPGVYVRMESFPLTTSGKLDRRALPAPTRADLLPESGRDASLPRDPLELMLVMIWQEVLAVRQVGIHDNFFELGGHSLLAVRLQGQIVRRLGATLPLSALFQHQTVAALAFYLRVQGSAPRHQTLVPLSRAGTRLPLFCIHPVGGNVLCYLEFVRALGQLSADAVPVYGVQASPIAAELVSELRLGRGFVPTETLPELAARYVAAIRQVQPQGPYQLLGWSMGGTLAQEMAWQLRQAQQEVAMLVLIDSFAPSPRPVDVSRPLEDATLLRSFLLGLMRNPGSSVALDSFDDCPSNLFHALALLRAQGLLAEDLDDGQILALYALFLCNLQIKHGHGPKPFDGKALLMLATERLPLFRQEHGWTPLCQGGLDVVAIPGNHFNLLTGESAALVAQHVSTRLRPF